MTDNVRPRGKGRRIWDQHGSWLVLIIVVLLSVNAGAEWQAYKDSSIIKSMLTSSMLERDSLRARLKEVNNRNQELARQLGPAVQKAEEAATKSLEAVDKATELLKGQDNGTNQ